MLNRQSCGSPNRAFHLSCNQINTNSSLAFCNFCKKKERRKRFCEAALPVAVLGWVSLVFMCLEEILIFTADCLSHWPCSPGVEETILALMVCQCCFFVLLQPWGSHRWIPEKVQALKTSNSGRGLQCFLGFANFHRDFVTRFTSVAAPLNTVIFSNVSLSWSPAAENLLNIGLKAQSIPEMDAIVGGHYPPAQ